MADVRQKVREELLPFAERLSAAVKSAGGLSRVVSMLGKPRATIDRWMNAQAAPSLLDVADLAKACDVSLEWLATGKDQPESEMLLESPNPNVLQIPILDVAASAGPGVEIGGEEITGFLPFPVSILRSLGVAPSKVRAFYSRGESMYPTIRDNALVLVDTGNRVLVDGPIFAIRGPDGLRLKRIQRTIDGSVNLISDNAALYPAERVSEADADRIRLVGRAFWTDKPI